MCPGLDPPLAHVADCSRMTSKPEVIPETESLPYLQKSQRRSRRRILSTRSLSFLCWCVQSVRNRHAQDYSELHQSRGSVNCESQKLLERLGVARVWHHTQNPPTFGSWGSIPLPAPTKEPVRDAGFKHIGSSTDELAESSPKMSGDAVVTGDGRTRA